MAEYKEVTPYDNVADSKKSKVTNMFDTDWLLTTIF